MWFRFLLVFCCSCLIAAPVFAASGTRGRVAWRTELIEGITVKAYRSVEDISRGAPVATSAPSDQDGVYQLDLPPGKYYLTATSRDGETQPGDLFGYFNGSPLQVPAEGYRNVGFNLIKVPEETLAKESSRSGVYGDITYQDGPIERVYLYVYTDPGSGFKGLGYFVQPVEKGRFRINLPPGDYYFLARKRARGGQFGPIEPGDFYSYYHGNPVHVSAGEARQIKIEMVERLATLEEEVVTFQGVRGRIVDLSGQPQSGLHVFAYRHAEMTGTPDFFSVPTDAEGRFALALPDAGPYYLLARQAFGGPAEMAELYGKYLDGSGQPAALDLSQSSQDVVIRVAPKE